MTCKERTAIQELAERLETFLLTHNDDHPVAVGNWQIKGGSGYVGCPVYQVMGMSGAINATEVLLSGNYSQVVCEVIGQFTRMYDNSLCLPKIGGRVVSLCNARKAIQAGIDHIRQECQIETKVDESGTRVPFSL